MVNTKNIISNVFIIFTLMLISISLGFGQSKLSSKKDNCLILADSLYNLADASYAIDNNKSLYYSFELLKIAKSCNDEEIFYMAHFSIGWAYIGLSNFPDAVNYAEKSLNYASKKNDNSKIIESTNLLGNIYLEIPDKDLALKYFNQGIAIAEATNDIDGLSSLYNNIAIAHELNEDFELSVKYYNLAKEIYESKGSDYDIALINVNIGDLYYQKEMYDSAFYCFQKARALLNVEEDKDLLFTYYICMSIDYSRKKDLKIASSFLDSAEMLLDLNFIPTDYINYHETRANVMSEFGKYEEAFKSVEIAYNWKDSILSSKIINKLRDIQIKAVEDKKEAEINELLQESKIQDLELASEKAKKNNYLLGVIIACVVSFFLIFVTYNNIKTSKKLKLRNKIIEEQSVALKDSNVQLELFNKEMTDSINYAKRIQDAVLPSRNLLLDNLKDGFVLFQPKDVVSGDFYWVEKFENKVFFAAADCTGHGVPGALVSIICSSALSTALIEEKITNTGKLLDKTRELVIEKLTKSGEDVNDGMDISLCSLTKDEDKNTYNLEWSGANNPLWIIRNEPDPKGEFDLNFIEFKPNKQPIGKYTNATDFDTHKVPLQKGDTIYIFTDGYADQFGGEKGKKFMYKPFKKLLVSINNLPMDEQKEVLLSQFESWKKDLEQVDDVCIIGVKV
jgi:serine phosphatase RsbU (regulator of sigma subunit)